MKKLYGLISLSIFLVLFSCTKDIAHTPGVSQEEIELNMLPVVNGDSVLQAFASSKKANTAMTKSTTAWYGSETLIYTSLPQMLTSTSAKAFETTSLVAGLITGKTYRIAIEFTGANPTLTNDGAFPTATMFQSLTNLPSGITTEKVESSDDTLAVLNNVRSFWLSYARLKGNFQKAYIMVYKPATFTSVNFTIKVYVSNDNYVTQNWVSVKDYVHYNQKRYPNFYVNANLTAKGGSICAQNAYYAALHMMLPSRFPATTAATGVTKTALNNIHTRLGIITSFVTPGSGNIASLKSLADNDPIMSPNVGGYLNTNPCSSLSSIQNKGDLGICNGGSYLNTHATRTDMKAGIESALAAGKYLVIPINAVNGNTNGYWYANIASPGKYGHVIVVVGLDITASGVGSRVYYKDGLGVNAETRMCDLTLFLDSNQSNSSSNYYQFLALKSCGCN